MYTINSNNSMVDALRHVFSSEGSRGVKKYKRDKPGYNKKKSRKGNEKDYKGDLMKEDATTIDIKC